MSFDIASLTAKESLWDTTGVWLAFAVAIGVAMESVAEFEALAEICRLNTLRGSTVRKRIAKAGLLILIVALAFEVVAAIQSHDVSEKIIAGLNAEIAATQEREQQLITRATALERALSEQGPSLNSLRDRSSEFETAVKEQKARDDAALALLKADQRNLERARSALEASAVKAASAAELANKTAAEMTATLDAEKAMRQRMEEIAIPWQIDDEHFDALVTALTPFAGTQIEFGLSRDPNSSDILVRIADALLKAHWTLKPWSGSGFGLQENGRPDIPTIGDVTIRGVRISVLDSDRTSLEAAVVALANGLVTSGIRPSLEALPAKSAADGKPDPSWVKPGIIRMIVGVK
jgi:hypothetical protein